MGITKQFHLESITPSYNPTGIKVPTSLEFYPVDDELLERCVVAALQEMKIINYMGRLDELLYQVIPVVIKTIKETK